MKLKSLDFLVQEISIKFTLQKQTRSTIKTISVKYIYILQKLTYKAVAYLKQNQEGHRIFGIGIMAKRTNILRRIFQILCAI